MHHVLRAVAERTRETGDGAGWPRDRVDPGRRLLPARSEPSGAPADEGVRSSAHHAVRAGPLPTICTACGRPNVPFQVRLEGLSIVGRADVILDREDGVPTALAILDYKASASDVAEHELQLQVYATAARRGDWTYVHRTFVTSRRGERRSIPVTPDATDAAITTGVEAGRRLRDRDFAPSPGPSCRRCEVRAVCASHSRRSTRRSKLVDLTSCPSSGSNSATTGAWSLYSHAPGGPTACRHALRDASRREVEISCHD